MDFDALKDVQSGLGTAAVMVMDKRYIYILDNCIFVSLTFLAIGSSQSL